MSGPPHPPCPTASGAATERKAATRQLKMPFDDDMQTHTHTQTSTHTHTPTSVNKN